MQHPGWDCESHIPWIRKIPENMNEWIEVEKL